MQTEFVKLANAVRPAHRADLRDVYLTCQVTQNTTKTIIQTYPFKIIYLLKFMVLVIVK